MTTPLHPFLAWLRELEPFVGDPYRFALRRGSELDHDRAALLNGWSAQANVSQILIRTATHQLGAARDMHSVGASPSAVPALVRAALETASTAAWLLQPSDPLTRVERFIRYMRQDSHDRTRWEGKKPDEDDKSQGLLQLGIAAGISRSRLKQRFSGTETVRDIDVEIDVDPERLWMLTSGLIHGRQWAVEEAARENSFDVQLTEVSKSRSLMCLGWRLASISCARGRCWMLPWRLGIPGRDSVRIHIYPAPRTVSLLSRCTRGTNRPLSVFDPNPTCSA